ncbi:MAG TPA: methylated-DNA--[protein]-cysteine S-methyltransferase [Thermoanaerobaculia bacterium]|jgi:methylated-DNA-[protein]-cysteine S-methyltransferase|nr:methylated-DNA--[protein]-cysteine S-methyltransferase [Thermoanaerobaculia bacterium]
MRFSIYQAPFGPLVLAADETGALAEIRFRGDPPDSWEPDPSALRFAAEQLDAFFAGRSQKFDLPLAPRGTTFQLSVWNALREIPYAETTSYGELARLLGRPAASRAVGAANGANPIPIVIPCHRVIGANRSLTGFGGGLPVKRWLLDHEARVAGRVLPF